MPAYHLKEWQIRKTCFFRLPGFSFQFSTLFNQRKYAFPFAALYCPPAAGPPVEIIRRIADPVHHCCPRTSNSLICRHRLRRFRNCISNSRMQRMPSLNVRRRTYLKLLFSFVHYVFSVVKWDLRSHLSIMSFFHLPDGIFDLICPFRLFIYLMGSRSHLSMNAFRRPSCTIPALLLAMTSSTTKLAANRDCYNPPLSPGRRFL